MIARKSPHGPPKLCWNQRMPRAPAMRACQGRRCHRGRSRAIVAGERAAGFNVHDHGL